MDLKGNAIVAQSGGPTAVINNSLCGVAETWFKETSMGTGTLYAGIGGIKGILNENIIDLGKQDREVISGLRYTPGAGIHSCRYKVQEDDHARLISIFKEHDIRYFFYNGGNDSMDTANKISKLAKDTGYDMRVIGIPKTVDNDLAYTDHCPGFGSAAKYLAVTVRETGIDLESVSTKNKITIIEAMGRNAGWLTAASILSKRRPEDAPHLVYLPEVAFSKEKFLVDVEKVYNNLGYVFIVVSEGIVNDKGDYVFASGNIDSFGHKQLSGAGEALKQLIESQMGINARCNTLGTAQRSATHFASLTDANEAYVVGAEGVKAALTGKSGVMVAIRRISDAPYQSTTELVPLDTVANVEHKVPLDWINEEGNYLNDNFIKYARPLIEGEVKIPMRDGLPDYVYIDFKR